MTFGFFGKVLAVDLSRGRVEEETLSPAVYRDYLGGYGLGIRLLYERMGAGNDPLGEENILGFVPGLLTGTGVPFSGRYMVVGKSPLTGGWGEANCGGHFGPALRATGFDGVFITGVSAEPVYLLIDVGKNGDDVQAELRDAGHLWGLDTVQTDRRLKEEVGRTAQVACIGPAGERVSLVAAIITDGGRAAARSGLGAVMGAKRLKAVVVRGSKRVPVRDRDTLSNLGKEYRQVFSGDTSGWPRLLFRLTNVVLPLLRQFRVKPSGGPTQAIIHAYQEYGTCSGTAFSTEVGDAPVRNWQGVGGRDFPLRRSALISDDAVIQHQTKKYHCRHCPLGCGGIVSLKGERYTVEEAHKPEYETLAAFGPLLLNDDLESIIQINHLCDRYGLDTISVGAIVAFAMECVERGLISGAEADGVEWGDADGIVQLVGKIARREGIGDLLADGVKRAAERIGEEAKPLAMHVGGQELPMHDSRYEPLVGLGYLVDPTPGRHTVCNAGLVEVPGLQETLGMEGFTPPGRYEYEGKGALFALVNRHILVLNCAGLCLFSLTVGRAPMREWINAATGWELSQKEMLRIGHRIQVLRHAFNLREGIWPGAADLSLPARAAGSPPLDEGPLRGVTLDMETMVQDYFQVMGYDKVTGVPSQEVLESLELADLVGDSLH